MNLIARLRQGRRQRDAAHRLYMAVVTRARDPLFYRELGVPDSLDGRFEMIALHAFLVMRRLKREGRAGAALSQALHDIMFADMDQSLRELGVGDLSVGRKVKAMARGLYGRIAAYEAGLAEGGDRLVAAIRRNVYGTVSVAA